MNAPALARQSETAGEPTVKHLWLPTGRTLCDLEGGDMPGEDVRELRAGFTAACGPCLLLVIRLSRDAAAYLELTDGAVAPDRGTEAWRLLAKTAWARVLDLETFLASTPDIDASVQWDVVANSSHPENIAERAAEMRRLARD